MALFDPDLQPSSDRGHLLTEQSNQRSSRLDQLDTLELVALFAAEDRRPQAAVAAATPDLAQAGDAVSERLRAGGRLFYLGQHLRMYVCSCRQKLLRQKVKIQVQMYVLMYQ